ncbi:MAG TPA: hypothetical protein VIS48_12325 [Candidatus Kryptonia bacterium]
MTTKAPAQVEKFGEESSESIAYKIAGTARTREPNDNNRLGYHIWRYLQGTIPSIDEAVRVSGLRLIEGETEEHVTEKVVEGLNERGLEVRRNK